MKRLILLIFVLNFIIFSASYAEASETCPDSAPPAMSSLGVSTVSNFKSVIEDAPYGKIKWAATFYPGWNLFSVPLYAGIDSRVIFNACDTVSDIIYKFDESSQQYATIRSGMLYPGNGYFIPIKSKCTITAEGAPYTFEGFELESGKWKLFGVGGKKIPLSSLNYKNCRCLAAYFYDTEKEEYEGSSEFLPGVGYWAISDASCSVKNKGCITDGDCKDTICPQVVGGDRPKCNVEKGSCYCGGSCGDGYCDSFEEERKTCPADCEDDDVQDRRKCSDTDGGKEYYESGIVLDAAQNLYFDGCKPDGKTVREYYCKPSGEGDVIEYECPQNCVAGACTGEPPSESECKDSDNGKDYYIAGTVIEGENIYIDSCASDGKTLKEYYCENGKAAFEEYMCEGSCVGGMCEPPEDGTRKCSDTDGGKEYYESGIVLDVNQNMYFDACGGDNLLKEYYCTSTGEAEMATFTCPNGCVAGECQLGGEEEREKDEEPRCTDTDGGINYNRPGTAMDNAGGSFSDVCASGKILQEAYCLNNKVATVAYECSGYCEDGRCKEREEVGKGEECKYGCMVEGKCVPIGFRKGDKYCDISGKMVVQKEGKKKCDNNYECESNLCLKKRCVQPSLIDNILKWFREFFDIFKFR